MISCFFERGDKAMCCFLGFLNPRLTNKIEKDHFKALGLKNVFSGDDKSLIYELILALVSLWLLVNSIKKEKSQRKTSD